MQRSSAPPQKLGRYDVLRRLGAGGMAEVYLGRSRGAEGTQKLVVLKRVLPTHNQSPKMRQMFVDEARLSMRLNHPNIVQVFDFQETPEGFLLCMEYVEGLDLGRLMSAARGKGVRLPPWVGAYIVMEAARGLHCAHERKGEDGAPLEIVHRDVSPQNILIGYEGAVKVADFGIATAKFLGEDAGVLKGKFAYMSPEQARGEPVDRRTDIYALGIVLHEILTGKLLYSGVAGDELLAMVRKADVEPPSLWASEVPPELDAICMKALAKNRDDRFSSARDMAGAIARALQKQDDLVDAAAVEATISQFSAREITSPGDGDADNPPPPPSVGLSEGLGAAVMAAPGADGTAAPDTNAPAIPSALAASLTAIAVPSAAKQRDPRKSSDGASEPMASAQDGGKQAKVQRELRHVACVHLKIQGFEELAIDLGAGALATARERCKQVLDGIAFKHGARWTWDEDGADFGGTSATGSMARAVVGLTANPSGAPYEAAALALDAHDALADLSQDLPIAIAASIGIVRAVAAGDRDEQGHLMNHAVAAPAPELTDALSAGAPAGRTWVAGGLYRLVRRDFQWGDAPTLSLPQVEGRPDAQQLPKTIRVYSLVRALTREERLAELALAPGELVGREVERADLQAAFHRAVASAQVVSRLIVGEMGIGKTALVATFLRDLPPDARAVRLECAPSHAEVPYAAVGELVRDACSLDGNESLAQAKQAITSIVGDLSEGPAAETAIERLAEVATGQLSEGGGEEDAGFRKKMLVSGVRRVLAALATRAPLVIVVEGVQWADRPSLELFTDLLRGANPIPCLVVLVARSDERIAPLLSGIVRVELRGLSDDEQLRLLEMRLGVKEGVANVCSELAARVGGNPFFLLEIVDALLERGALEIRETTNGSALVRTARGAQMPLPSTLEQLLAERLHELPSDEKGVAQWIAVAGGPLDVSVLRDVSVPPWVQDDEGRAQHSNAVEETIGRLCARGICDRKGESIDLRHPVARDVAYMTIDAASRVRMHRLLGERLRSTPQGRGLSAAIVARHLARGDSPEASAEMFLEAANAARASYQVQLATRYYHRALSLLPDDDPRRFAAHEALEGTYRVTGRRRERKKQLVEMRNLARAMKNPRAVIVALLRTARLDFDEAHLARGLPVAHQAVNVAQQARMPALVVEAYALVVDFLRELGDVEGALRTANEALAISNQTPISPRLKADVLRAKGILLRRLGRTQEAVTVYAESIALLRGVGAKRSEARTKNALAYSMFVLARYEDAIALAMSSVALDLSIGGRFQIAKTLTNIGQCYARLGDLPRALAYLRRARDAHERYGDQDGRTDTLLVSAEILIWSGDLDGAATFVGDARALVTVTGNAYDGTHELITRAMLLRARNDLRAAADLAAQARPIAQTRGLASFHLYATAIEAEARAALGETAHASLLAQTASGLVEATEGSEYALDVRTLCAHALDKCNDVLAPEAWARARSYARKVLSNIRDPRLRQLFLARKEVSALLGAETQEATTSATTDRREPGVA